MKRYSARIDGGNSRWRGNYGVLVGLHGNFLKESGLAGSRFSGQEDIPVGVIDKSRCQSSSIRNQLGFSDHLMEISSVRIPKTQILDRYFMNLQNTGIIILINWKFQEKYKSESGFKCKNDMKNNLSAALLLVLAITACGPRNEYTIGFEATGAPDSLVVHNNWYTSSDTLTLVNGRCTFIGTIDTFPKLVSLGFPLPSQKNTRMILEPGTISVKYSEENGFRLGGTRNNLILQELFDTLKPYQDESVKIWREWNKAYAKDPRSKEECESIWLMREQINQRLLDKTRDLIRANPNYAGLVISLPVVRTEPVEYLKQYVDEFRKFKNDQRYQGIVKDYEIAERTVSGKPVPGFAFPDTTGKMVSLAGFRGKWVLLDFWYVDCPWCRKLTPHMIEIYKDWNLTRNFEIISISVDKPKDYGRWKEAIRHDGAVWTQVLDSTKTYPDEYGITGYPTLILVDPQGNGVKKIVGYQEEGGLRRLLGDFIH
jgi:thiol-disulfide isomerase/thioredoxin